MKKYAVIVAGGKGERMGMNTPKQFLLLHGKPILWHTIHCFTSVFEDIEIILVLPKNHLREGEDLIHTIQTKHAIQLIEGGATRFHSVQNGLKQIEEESIVFVQDGVRCLSSKHLIETCYKQALERGSAIPVVTATDSIRLIENTRHSVLQRNKVAIVQTPQTFQSNIILPAFAQIYQEVFTDEATVVEAFGKPVFLCEGDYNNIKITRPVDLIIAEKIMQEVQPS